MVNKKSHFGPSLYISLPVVLALVGGITLGVRSTSNDEREGRLAQVKALNLQANLLADHMRQSLSQMRQLAFQAQSQWNQGYRTIVPYLRRGKILHLQELRTKGGLHVARSAYGSQFFRNEREKSEFETSINKLAMETPGLLELKASSMKVLALPKFQETSKTPRIYTAIFRVNPQSMLALSFYPLEVFSQFKRFSKLNGGQNMRAYLLNQEGGVLAHSQRSYVGASFAKTEVFAQVNKGRASSQALESIDKLPVLIGRASIKGLPMRVVVEDLSLSQASSMSSPWQQSLGEGLAILGGLSLIILISSWAMRRRTGESGEEPQTKEAQPEQTLTTLNASPEEATDTLLEVQKLKAQAKSQEDRLKRELGWDQLKQQAMIQTLREPTPPQPKIIGTSAPSTEEILTAFESHMAKSKNPKDCLPILSQTVSKLCRSPVLFFGYDSNRSTAQLQFSVGMDQDPRLKGEIMRFRISTEFERRTLNLASANRIASFRQYEPLARLMLERMGTGFFEAWGITTFRSPRLMGIMLILNAGVDSKEHRAPLAKLMRRASQVMERSYYL